MFLRLSLCLAVVSATAACASVTRGDEPVKYSTQIAPVLQSYCVSCHSRVEAQSGLSLQAPDDILKGSENGNVLNPDSPEKSLLLQVVTSHGDDQMPPADQPQPTADELKLLTRWLTEGARFDSRLAVLPMLPKVRVTASTIRAPALTMEVANDGQSVFVGRFRVVEQRSRTSNEVLWSLPIPDGKVNSVRLSADGQRVLIATGTPGLSGRALEVEVGSSVVRQEFGGHNDILYAADWSPDGAIVATAGYDRKIVLHNAQTGEKIRELSGHNGAVFDLRFSPDGTLLASASADATIKIWHVAAANASIRSASRSRNNTPYCLALTADSFLEPEPTVVFASGS